MPQKFKKFVILSKYLKDFQPPFAIVVNGSNNLDKANELFEKQSTEDEIVILLNTESQKILRQQGDIETMRKALDVNFPKWHN